MKATYTNPPFKSPQIWELEEAIEEAARAYFSLQVEHLKRQKGR